MKQRNFLINPLNTESTKNWCALKRGVGLSTSILNSVYEEPHTRIEYPRKRGVFNSIFASKGHASIQTQPLQFIARCRLPRGKGNFRHGLGSISAEAAPSISDNAATCSPHILSTVRFEESIFFPQFLHEILTVVRLNIKYRIDFQVRSTTSYNKIH